MPRRPERASACAEHLALDRRRLLLSGAAASLTLWAGIPRASAAGRDPRLLVIVLRGGLDGLALAAPAADPDYVRLRGAQALSSTGEHPGLPLDGMFLLNPAMKHLHALYRKRQALIVHATATPYRQRSHFDGQDVLESGLPGVGRSDAGWLNRALSAVKSDGRANPKGLAIGAVVPLVIRGPAPVLSWIPQVIGMPLRDSTVARLMDLYAEADPALANAFADGMAIERLGGGAADASRIGSPVVAASAPAPPDQRFRRFIETATVAARFMSNADGPRIGALSYDGWDTHANEGVLAGQLANRLSGLDAAIQALATGMGAAWKDTVAVIVTEFGRTARINGTEGTDHGTATAAVLVGGALAGERVIADWPGLAERALHEGRDLRPTRDLRTVLKGVLRDHLGVPTGTLSSSVFPSSAAVTPLGGLLASV
jgi:uncharacterized protein (DUF1501 family)